jgi:hypothetical protein
MKLTKKTALYTAVFALAVLTGCSNVLLEKPGNGSGGGIPAGEAGDLPEGFGAVAIQLTSGAARTAMPTIELDSLHLEYWFTGPGDGGPVAMEPEGGIFVLEAGDYSLEALAYADGAKESLVARGTTEAPFTVAAGSTLELDVNLRPAEGGGGEGELAFTLRSSVEASVEILTLSRIAGGEEPIELAAGGISITPELSRTESGIPAGYYLLRVVVKNSAGASAGRTAVAHIFRDLPTEISYAFSAEDFRIYRVSSADDTGTGTLRQAIIDTQAMGEPQIIQLALGPGAVIELGSALPEIRESLTIEGNGATLTRAESWTSSNDQSQLLRITSTTAEVLIRRLHFKNGLARDYGGAVRNSGILTLESCVFSGNRITDSYAYCGAVYSQNTLTVRGCTFYGNTGTYYAGAIFFDAWDKTLTLTGNLFYGNTANNYPAVYNGGSVAASHNVVDTEFGTGNNQAGWAIGDGDTTISALPVSPRRGGSGEAGAARG